ncbi:MAG: hypothetical protein AB1611_00690 [bacterium]
MVTQPHYQSRSSFIPAQDHTGIAQLSVIRKKLIAANQRLAASFYQLGGREKGLKGTRNYRQSGFTCAMRFLEVSSSSPG